MDANHLQDFTMVEGYSAYWNYRDNMKFLKDMIIYILSNLYNGDLNKLKEAYIICNESFNDL